MTATPVGSEVLVNTTTSGDQQNPKTAALTGGGVVIVWEDASDSSVKAQLFDASGAKVGGEIVVSTASAGAQHAPQVSALANGGFAVTWADESLGSGGAGGDTSSTAVKAQVFGANGAPVGSEILVNTATAGAQTSPQIAALTGGNFVITWEDNSAGSGGAGGDSDGKAVKAQVFNATGSALGGEILVNTTIANNQYEPKIATLGNGNFAISWTDATGDADEAAVKTQIFNSTGGKVGFETLVNVSFQTDDQLKPKIIALADGGFVVAHQDWRGYASNTIQVFDASGTQIGSFTLPGGGGPWDENASFSITALADGGFAVVWNDDSHDDYRDGSGLVGHTASDGDEFGVLVAAYKIVGGSIQQVFAPTLVNSNTSDDQRDAQIVALPDGGFVVTFQDWNADGSSWSVKAQQFNPAGVKVGDEIVVNTHTAGAQYAPQVAPLTGSKFVIAWTDEGGDPGGYAVKAQFFDVTSPSLGAASVLSIDGDTSPTSTYLDAGSVVRIVIMASTSVVVDTTHGAPTLILSGGGLAQYNAAESTSTQLVFDYTVAPGENTPDLIVTSLSLNGATIKDAVNNDFDLTGPANSDLGLTIDTTAPDTSITQHPSAISGSTSATFAFSGDGTGSGVARFEVSLDGAAYQTATGPLTLSGLSEGEHTFAVRTVDVAGNIDITPASYTWAVRTVPDLTGITDDTRTGGDLVTSDTSLTFTGTAASNSLVEVFVDGVSVAFGNADNDGSWSIDATSQYGEFAEGSYAIQILQTLGGTTKVSASQMLTVDTTVAAPCIMGISPDTGIDESDSITSSSTLIVFGEAEANSTIAIWDGATLLGTTVADPCGCWAYTTPALSDGPHSFTAIATDVAGNVSAASTARAMTVDTAVAAPVISSVITDDTGISSTDRITNDTTFTLTGTAEAFSTVTVHVDGTTTITGTVVADASGNWSFTTTELAGQSNYFCYATATDLAGNVSGHLSPIVVTLDTEAPTTVPVINAVTTDTGASATDGVTRDRTVVLSGTGEASSLVEILLDGHAIGVVTTDGTGAWTFDHSGTVLTDGTYHFAARTIDVAGNASPLSGEVVVVIDNVAPAAAPVTGISGDSGSSGSDYITNNANIAINGTAEADAVVEIFLDGVSRGTATADGSGAWSFDATAITLADGHHQLITRVSDVAGNSRLSAPVDVLVDTATPVVPTVTSWGDDTYYFFQQFEAVGNGHDGITQDSTITLNGTGEAGSIITVFDGVVELGTTVVGAGGSWTYTTAPLIDGDHSLTVTSTDIAGNESAASAATDVHVDTTNPVRPAVTGIRYDTGADAADGVTNDTHVILMGTAEPGTRVWLTSFGIPPGYNVIGGGLGFEFADANGHWEVDLSNLEVFTSTSPFHGPFTFTDRQYTFFAEAVDLASNGSGFGSTFTVTIDTTPPAAAVITGIADDTGASLTDAITSDTTPTLNGTAEAGAFIEVFEGATSLGTVRTDEFGQWSFDLGTVSEGSHSYTANITDLAGNPGPQSSPFAITVDAIAPDTTITANPNDPSNSASASFSFTGSDPGGTGVAGFEVSIDGGEFVAGVSPSDLNDLADGSHTVEVRAVDNAGNRDATPASFTWVIDTTGPDTTLTATPPSISASANASFSFTANDGSGTGVAGFEASLDGGGFFAATSPVVYTGLSDGPHTVVVRAIDTLGNVEPTPASYTWTVDTTPPDAPVVVSPGNGSATKDATISGTAEPDSIVTVFIDGAAAGTATADHAGDWTFSAPTNLSEGSHTVRARASDAAGNTSVDSITSTFVLDTVGPVATAAAVLSIDGDTGVTTGDLNAGHVVRIVITTDDNVVVDTTGGVPALVLDDGGSASYIAAASDSTHLVFSYTVAAGENTSSLTVTSLSLNGATIRDAVGNGLNASGVANADLGVGIDTIAPATPAAPVLASDTGFSSTDKLTSDPRIAYPTATAGAVLLYSLDGGSFTTTAPVFATNGSVDGQHTVAIKEKDAAGNIGGASSLTFTLDTLAPHITSDGGGDAATVAIAEKSTSVTTVVATDQHPVTYSIAGGADQSKFQINTATGAVSFITPPDFEHPTDADQNGSYIVRVRASDGSLAADQTITVNVTDVPETTHWMQSVSVGAHPAGWAPTAFADFNGDGASDVLWYNAGNNNVETWKIANGQWAGSVDIGSHPPGYNPVGAGDFNHDGTSDVLWVNPATNETDIWMVSNGGWAGSANIGQHPAGYQVAGIGDFNHDGTSDVLWVNPATNETDIWLVNNGQWAGSTTIGTHPAGYQIAGIGDFNQDRTSDVVWYNPATNDVDVWLVQDGHWAGSVSLGAHPPGAQLIGIGDFDHNGVSDVMWRDSSNGSIETWLLEYN